MCLHRHPLWIDVRQLAGAHRPLRVFSYPLTLIFVAGRNPLLFGFPNLIPYGLCFYGKTSFYGKTLAHHFRFFLCLLMSALEGKDMSARLPIVRNVKLLRDTVQAWRLRGKTIALVPTMGSLHEGHLSLVRLARKYANRVVVSVFVNPTQFGPAEDFAAYPRDEEGDWRKLASAKADLMYAPPVSEVYPDDFATRVEVAEITQTLEGVSRPHHFAGVTTVVTKLFLQCLPDYAIFGEKDYQQLLVIRRLVKDLDLPIEIIGAPVVREADGLAMSSRNAYLSEAQRLNVAPQLNLVLKDVAAELAAGAYIDETLEHGRARLEAAGFKVDYLDVRRAEDLTHFEGEIDAPARVLAAVYLGQTRLIDNMPVPERRRK